MNSPGKAHYFVVNGTQLPDGTIRLVIDHDVRFGQYTIYDEVNERWHNCEGPDDYAVEEAVMVELARRLANQEAAETPSVTTVTP